MKIITETKGWEKISLFVFFFIITLSTHASGQWVAETLDGGYLIFAGRHCALDLDSNDRVHIVYHYSTNASVSEGHLKYITNMFGAEDTWDTNLIDFPPNNSVGYYNSIKLDSNDNIHVSYYNVTDGYLKYAYSNSWPSWSTTNVDTVWYTGHDTSIAVSGTPSSSDVHISYYYSSGKDLKYATKTIIGGTWATNTLIDGGCSTGCEIGQYTSIGVDSDGDIHISYYENVYGRLMHITNKSGAWVETIVAGIGSPTNTSVIANHRTSLAIDSSDNLHISFYDFLSKNLKYATNSSGAWTVETAHNSLNDVGKFSSIALDSNENVHIAYYDETEADLEYTNNSNGVWVNTTLDNDSYVGEYASIGIDSADNIHIAYFKETGVDLKYAANKVNAPYVIATSPGNTSTGVSLDSIIYAAFSEPMDSSTITTGSFTVSDGVTGTITYNAANNTAIFTPDNNLSADTAYMVTITEDVTDSSGEALGQDFTWNFTTVASVDTTAPTVLLTTPSDLGTNISANIAIIALFSEDMDPATITTSSFTLAVQSTGGSVNGTVTYDAQNRIAIFTPDNTLSESTAYVATITTDVQDTAGNAMASESSWTFTTGNSTDSTAPTITSVTPGNGATGITKGSTVIVQFSEAMDPRTLNSNSIIVSEGGVGTVTYSPITQRATLTFFENLDSSKLYTATVTNDVKDLSGNAMESSYQWTFTTTPGVKETWPANQANNIDTQLNREIEATFYGDMDPSTINTTTFTLTRNNATVPSTVTYDANERTAKLDVPSSFTLYSGATYTVTVTTGAQDTNGVPLEEDYIWTFTTYGQPSGDGGGGCFISTLK